jgi:hypothetical protein
MNLAGFCPSRIKVQSSLDQLHLDKREPTTGN